MIVFSTWTKQHTHFPSILLCFILSIFVQLSIGTDIVFHESSTEKVDLTNSEISLQPRSSFLSKEECNCTSYLQCDFVHFDKETNSDNEANSDENGAERDVVDIRFGAQAPDFPCSHYLEICCNKYQRGIESTPQTPKKPLVSVNAPFSCGRRNARGVGFRIVGGIEGEAQMGEFTWMIAVTEINRAKNGTVYLCGGSLIHPRVVLTAAHCLDNKAVEDINVRAGEWDTQTEREDPFTHHDRYASEVIIHEDYQKRGSLKNDIALIVLSKEVPIARHIGTVCLSKDLNPSPGSKCTASGWGKHLYGKEGSYQSILKKVDLPIVSQTDCEEKFRGTRLGEKFRLHRSFVCAGGVQGKDTCKGDGGSPLVCKVPGLEQYAQYGIVSWGLDCGTDLPAAYVNVPRFVPWIEAQFNQLGLDSSSFKPIE